MTDDQFRSLIVHLRALIVIAGLIAGILIGMAWYAAADPISAEQYRAQIGPCACPDDKMAGGKKCGHVSAYCRYGGLEPVCFPGDDKGQRELNRKAHCGHVC